MSGRRTGSRQDRPVIRHMMIAVEAAEAVMTAGEIEEGATSVAEIQEIEETEEAEEIEEDIEEEMEVGTLGGEVDSAAAGGEATSWVAMMSAEDSQ